MNSTTTTAVLTELTLRELSDSLTDAAESSSGNELRAWNLLVGLAADLAAVSRNEILVEGRKWALVKMSVEGFRGARHPLDLHIEHVTGLTILHGANGSGKSSIAEALRMALEGRTGATHLGESGRLHELWGNTDERSRGSASAKVTVNLRDLPTNDSLVITALLSGAGVERDAVLISEGKRHFFDAQSDAWIPWGEAIRTSPPVLAYAELADELQKRRDLHLWLSSCLAMDNAIRLFDSHVKEKNDAARIAAKSISEAQIVADEKLRAVDAEWTASGVENIVPVAWAVLDSEKAINTWLAQEGLAPRDITPVDLKNDPRVAIAAYIQNFQAALAGWHNAASTSLTPHVETAIVDLDQRVKASGQDDHDGICPTCGSTKPDWREHLHVTASKLGSARTASTALKEAIRGRRDSLTEPLQLCLDALPRDYADQPSVSECARLLTELAKFDAETDDLEPELCGAVADLALWTERDEAKGLIEAAVAAAGRRTQWLAHRWSVIAAYLDRWNQESEAALQYPSWRTAVTRWNSHLGDIRKQRSASLHSLVGPAVKLLLGDVGISVDSTAITKSESRLVLKDRLDEVVDFSHLSAGQRNALILGPIIATAEGGIFGFTLLDDPVHAFDDFRVDQLSATLARMGRAQALILTTHDARFVEYLLVHSLEEFTVFKAERDDVGVITLTETNAPWVELVDFAGDLLSSSKHLPESPVNSDIAALLRMAVDEALEGLSLRYIATLDATTAGEVRQKFGGIPTTRGRAKALRAYVRLDVDKTATFHRSWNLVEGKLDVWSGAIHDESHELDREILALHIGDTRMACADWSTMRWS